MPVQHFWPEAQHTLGELWLPKAKLPVPSQKPCIKLSCSIPKAWGRDIHPLSLPWPQKAPPPGHSRATKEGVSRHLLAAPGTTATPLPASSVRGQCAASSAALVPPGLGPRAEGPRAGPLQTAKGHPLAQGSPLWSLRGALLVAPQIFPSRKFCRGCVLIRKCWVLIK